MKLHEKLKPFQQAEAEKAARLNGGAKPKVPKVHRLEKAASIATEVISHLPSSKSGKHEKTKVTSGLLPPRENRNFGFSFFQTGKILKYKNAFQLKAYHSHNHKNI